MPHCTGCKHTKITDIIIEKAPYIKDAIDTYDLDTFREFIQNSKFILPIDGKEALTQHRNLITHLNEINRLIGPLPNDSTTFEIIHNNDSWEARLLGEEVDTDYIEEDAELPYLVNLERGILTHYNPPIPIDQFRSIFRISGELNENPKHQTFEGLYAYWTALQSIADLIHDKLTLEYCPHCEGEMIVSRSPLKQRCPVCKNELMICSECETDDQCSECPHK